MFNCETPAWINEHYASLTYCKPGNYRENFIFAKSVKIHICDGKKSRLGHVLHGDDRVISQFFDGFIFTKLRIFREHKPSRKSEFEIHVAYTYFSRKETSRPNKFDPPKNMAASGRGLLYM